MAAGERNVSLDLGWGGRERVVTTFHSDAAEQRGVRGTERRRVQRLWADVVERQELGSKLRIWDSGHRPPLQRVPEPPTHNDQS